jgi:hypothetical protein
LCDLGIACLTLPQIFDLSETEDAKWEWSRAGHEMLFVLVEVADQYLLRPPEAVDPNLAHPVHGVALIDFPSSAHSY